MSDRDEDKIETAEETPVSLSRRELRNAQRAERMAARRAPSAPAESPAAIESANAIDELRAALALARHHAGRIPPSDCSELRHVRQFIEQAEKWLRRGCDEAVTTAPTLVP